MNKEQTIDEAYVNFEKWYNEHSGKEDYINLKLEDSFFELF